MEPGESSCFPSGACWPPGRSTSQHSRHRECSASACSPLGRLHQDLSPRSDKGFATSGTRRSEEHTSELQSRLHLVCRLLLEKKKQAISCPTQRLTGIVTAPRYC